MGNYATRIRCVHYDSFALLIHYYSFMEYHEMVYEGMDFERRNHDGYGQLVAWIILWCGRLIFSNCKISSHRVSLRANIIRTIKNNQQPIQF